MYHLEGESFHTIPHLIHHYQTSQQHITKKSEIVLRRPVLKVPKTGLLQTGKRLDNPETSAAEILLFFFSLHLLGQMGPGTR